MKSSEAMKILKITRPTLTKYIQNGKLQVEKIGENRYDYLDDSVFDLVSRGKERTNVCIVDSTDDDVASKERQLSAIREYCNNIRGGIGGYYEVKRSTGI